ncbi:MAG: tRNA 2-selenouridine(34) synthase MnmH, partial [Betaproteobacteria bacterium]|nr:tRNA 2-selenouridine(34) synthase MnmH [Betaproteobacteria bacterium]
SVDDAIAQFEQFDDLLDTRSPSEFELDHVPGAISTPVLDDAQRVTIGTIHSQRGAFDANRLGAAWVARNVGRHIEETFQDRPRSWAPLVYCWRGGQRSNAMATVLARIGWSVRVLEGGYRAYRRQILMDLGCRPEQCRWIVLAGRTGSAKSRILEGLARHRGSVLGGLPDALQPTQKWFESMVWNKIRGFDPSRPVFVESESKKVGQLHIPDALIQAMRKSPCIHVEVPANIRAQFLIGEYAHWTINRDGLLRQIEHIAPLHPKQRIIDWKQLIITGDWPAFVESLLIEHYDPSYDRAMDRNFEALSSAMVVNSEALDHLAIECMAQQIATQFINQASVSTAERQVTTART